MVYEWVTRTMRNKYFDRVYRGRRAYHGQLFVERRDVDGWWMEDLGETGTIGIGEKAGSFYMRKLCALPIYHLSAMKAPRPKPRLLSARHLRPSKLAFSQPCVTRWSVGCTPPS